MAALQDDIRVVSDFPSRHRSARQLRHCEVQQSHDLNLTSPHFRAQTDGRIRNDAGEFDRPVYTVPDPEDGDAEDGAA